MGLTDKKEEQLKKMPNIDFTVFVSKDKRYIIHRTTITDIKPIGYYQKVIDNPTASQVLEEQTEQPPVKP